MAVVPWIVPAVLSAQADLTFACEFVGLFLLGSPAASGVEGESWHEVLATCVFVQKCAVGECAHTQPNAVVDRCE